MQVFRIGTVEHTVWDGGGAALTGGRWNKPGTAVIYAAGSRALAMLERLAQRRKLTGDLMVTAEVPDDLEWTDMLNNPPPGWQDRDGAAERAGMGWLMARKTALMRVPSLLVPEEANWVINPAHPQASRIVAAVPRALIWNSRFLSAPGG